MFGLFKKEEPWVKLEKEYHKLLEQSFKLSTTNRAESDKLRAKAEEIGIEISKLKHK